MIVRLAALWVAVFTALVIGVGAVALLIWFGVTFGQWWVPVLVIAAFLIATLAVAIEYLTNRPEEEEVLGGPGAL